jgi:hypothetical protein
MTPGSIQEQTVFLRSLDDPDILKLEVFLMCPRNPNSIVVPEHHHRVQCEVKVMKMFLKLEKKV